MRRDRRLLPKIALVVGKLEFLKKSEVFVLKGEPTVMLLLLVDVLRKRGEVGGTDREGPVSALPTEFSQGRRLSFQPFGGSRLEGFNQFCGGQGSGELDCQMHVVRHPANPIAFAIEATRGGCEVGVQVWSKFGVEVRNAVFGGKDDVKEDMGEGLRHGT